MCEFQSYLVYSHGLASLFPIRFTLFYFYEGEL
jgi:hypothetical protein